MRKDEPVGTYYIVQPDPGDGAEVVEPMPGVRQLVAGGPSGTLSVQVPGRMGGPGDAARFARSLASAALDFAQWCEQQSGGAHRLREDSPGIRTYGYAPPEEQA